MCPQCGEDVTSHYKQHSHNKIKLSTMQNFKKAAMMAAAHKTIQSAEGRQILEKLKSGPKTATELKNGTSTPYHLRKLLAAGIVTLKREGTTKIYSENPEVLLKYMRENLGEPSHLIAKSKVRRAIITRLLKTEEYRFPYRTDFSAELNKLLKAGLVEKRKEGRSAFWRKTQKLENLLQSLSEI